MTLDSKNAALMHSTVDTTPTHVPIPHRLVTPANLTWFTIALVSILLFVLGLPFRFAELITLQSDVLAALDQAGVSRLGWALGMLTPEVLLMLVFTIVGVSIYVQKPRDMTILLVSLLLITWGTSIMNVVEALVVSFPLLEIWVLFSRALSWSLVMTVLLIFPNGQLYPEWSKWLLGFWLVLIWSWFFFPSLPHNVSVHGGLADPLRFGIYFGLVAVGGIAQTQRYRKVSSPTERQQAKWAFLGIGLMFLIAFFEEAPSAIDPTLIDMNTPESILYVLISTGFFVVGSLAFPFGLAASIQQTRLWKIDYVINRGLVYFLATSFLLFTFYFLFQVLQILLSSLTGDQQPAVVALVSALIAVVLFRPARSRLQRYIDERYYHIKIDYRGEDKTKSTFSFQLLEDYHQVGDYEIIEMIARGGMSEIFKGKHVATGEEAAIKILLKPFAQYAEFRQRFAHEAKIISQMDHDNIVKLYDYGETDDLYYIIMEFVSYHTLANQMKTAAPFDLDFTQHIICQTAQALDYAHNLGVIHRDVKPSNLLLRSSVKGTPYPQPVLSDFGIAKAEAPTTGWRRTGFVGSFDYISPEQIRASDDVDCRTDIYSLGVLAFQMLAGELPFSAETHAAMLIAHIQQPPPNLLAYNADVPDRTAYAIMRAMAKDPADRFADAASFAQALVT
jgi:tRNA A-37 threonylcarbamoyl transferase component Bud32